MNKNQTAVNGKNETHSLKSIVQIKDSAHDIRMAIQILEKAKSDAWDAKDSAVEILAAQAMHELRVIEIRLREFVWTNEPAAVEQARGF